MGHDEHFLRRLDRVAEDHVELALTLYRDQELLAEVLGRAALPEGTERLAISLDDPQQGPFVIVTRGGRFVTCLGKGMRVDGDPVLTKERLDAAVSKVERMRERLAQAVRSAEHGGITTTGRVFARMKHHGLAVSREDVELLLQVRPLMAPGLTKVLFSKLVELRELRPRVGALRLDRLRPAERDLVDAYGRAAWIYAHMLVLSDHEDVALRMPGLGVPESWWLFARTAAELGTVAHMTRALWMLARHAKEVLPVVKAAEADPRVHVVVLRELSLGVIAYASSKLRAEALKALRTTPPGPHPETWERGLALIGGELANAIRGIRAHEAEFDGVGLLTGKHIVVAMVEGAAPTDEQVEAVPDDVARAMWPNLGVSMLGGDEALNDIEIARAALLARSDDPRSPVPSGAVRLAPASHGHWDRGGVHPAAGALRQAAEAPDRGALRRQGGPQRSLPVRQRREVQALLCGLTRSDDARTGRSMKRGA